MDRIEIHQAFVWSCLFCDENNYSRAIVAELSPEEKENLKRTLGADENAEPDVIMVPTTVVCRHCEKESETKDTIDEESDDNNEDLVDLFPFWVFDCYECGRENFCNGEDIALTEEEIEEIRRFYDMDEWEDNDFMVAPRFVKCQYCNTGFEAYEHGDGDDFDLDKMYGD
jgi:hypothetical protein